MGIKEKSLCNNNMLVSLTELTVKGLYTRNDKRRDTHWYEGLGFMWP